MRSADHDKSATVYANCAPKVSLFAPIVARSATLAQPSPGTACLSERQAGAAYKKEGSAASKKEAGAATKEIRKKEAPTIPKNEDAIRPGSKRKRSVRISTEDEDDIDDPK